MPQVSGCVDPPGDRAGAALCRRGLVCERLRGEGRGKTGGGFERAGGGERKTRGIDVYTDGKQSRCGCSSPCGNRKSSCREVSLGYFVSSRLSWMSSVFG